MGLLTLFSGPYALLARGVIYLVLLASVAGWGAYRMHEHDVGKYDDLKKEYVTFQAQVEAQGKVAQAAADKQKAADIAAKEKADAENKQAVAGLQSDLDRLRHQHPPGHTVPPAPAGTSRADLACFDRTLLGAAVDNLLADLQGQAASGAAATVDLNSAKRWANP